MARPPSPDDTVTPAGEYEVVLKDLRLEFAKPKGPARMAVWTFAIESGDHRGEEIRVDTVLTSPVSWGLHKILRACGLTDYTDAAGDWRYTPLADGRIGEPRLVGARLTAVVAEERGRRRVRFEPRP